MIIYCNETAPTIPRQRSSRLFDLIRRNTAANVEFTCIIHLNFQLLEEGECFVSMVANGLQFSQESIASRQRPVFPFSDVYDGARRAD
jgi:hypothetical protein